MALLLTTWILASAVWGSAYGGCNEKHAAKPNDVIYITSPGYPGNFTQYVDCYYELYSTSDHPGLLVYVDVVDVTLNCDDDTTHLHVYDGFSGNPRFLGQICAGGQQTFESPKQTLYLSFRSRAQHAGRSRGFRLRVRTVPKYCHCFTQETAILDVTPSPALLSSPYYPYGTQPNVNCRWLLKAPEGKRVNVTLLHTDMKGSADCHHFGLYLYDGKTSYDDKLLATVCHNSVQTIQSTGPYLLVVFTSGPLVYRSGGGVKLQYSAIPADGSDRQMISHTLFYIITALLILLIVVIIFIAVIKLFLLPNRRKQAERRRRAARARLTRVSRHGSGQSQPSSQGEAGRHASCSRASSSVSGSSVSSQLSATSLTRLLGLYGLNKGPQEHRRSSRTGHTQECVYSPQRSGLVFRVPDFSVLEADGAMPHDPPPSYEEAIGQVTGQGVGGFEVTGLEVRGHEVTELEVRGHEVTGQAVRGHEVGGQSRQRAETQTATLGESVRRDAREEEEVGSAREEPGRWETVAQAVEQAVVAEGERQTAVVAEGERQTAVVADMGRQTAVVADMGRQTADVAEGERQTAVVADMRRQTAVVAEGERQTAVVAEGERQTAVVADMGRQTAVVAEGERQTAVVAEGERQTAVVADMGRQTAVVADMGRQTADVAEGERQTAVVADMRRQTAVVAEGERQTAVAAEGERQTAVEHSLPHPPTHTPSVSQ